MTPAVGYVFAALEDARRVLVASVAGLDAQALRAALPGGNSIATLLWHAAAVERWWVEEVLEGRPMPEDVRHLLGHDISWEKHLPEPALRPPEHFLALLKSQREHTRRLLLGWSDGDLDRAYPDLAHEHTYTGRWVLNHLVQHDMHHEGQIRMLRGSSRR